MAGGDPLGNAQPQPISAGCLVTRPFTAHERVGDDRQQRWRNPWTAVVDVDEHPCGGPLQRDRNILGITQRIDQQVLQTALQQQGIPTQAVHPAVHRQWFLVSRQVRTLARNQSVQVHLLQVLLLSGTQVIQNLTDHIVHLRDVLPQALAVFVIV
ncbi:hypothetical protein D3C76_1377330 [compost metagenome]